MRGTRRAHALLALFAIAPLGAVDAQSDTEERPLPPFSKLRAQNGVDVHLTQADRERVRIEVEGVDLEDVVTEVVDDELRISRPGWRNLVPSSRNRVDAYLDFVRLSDIDVSGGSDVRGENTIESEALTVRASGGSDVRLAVNARQLDFALSGGSDLVVEGRTEVLGIEANGGSDVSARGLEARVASVNLSGGSDAVLDVRERIDIEAHGGSDVAVHGNPPERAVSASRSSDVTWR